METLTKRQTDILTFMKEYMCKKGYPPTVREIGKALGISSPATVHTHLSNLEEKGYIKKDNFKNRAIELCVDNEFQKANEDVIRVPLLGTITAGSPIEAIEMPDEFFSLPISMLPSKKEVFTLRVSGLSMINAGIYDGDIVIIQRQKDANNGDIVAAMTEENEVTLKRFFREKDHIRLQPENNSMSPILLTNVSILGKAIGIYRKL